jgi:predicted RNA binding protein YcfA (HicA-like mRNA interferase family)
MRAVSGREMARILERLGWQFIRVCGSHHLYGKEGRRIVIPIHGNQTLKTGLQSDLMNKPDSPRTTCDPGGLARSLSQARQDSARVFDILAQGAGLSRHCGNCVRVTSYGRSTDSGTARELAGD